MVVLWKLDQVWNMGHDILSMENPVSVCNVLNTKQHKSIATNLLYEGIINDSHVEVIHLRYRYLALGE